LTDRIVQENKDPGQRAALDREMARPPGLVDNAIQEGLDHLLENLGPTNAGHATTPTGSDGQHGR